MTDLAETGNPVANPEQTPTPPPVAPPPANRDAQRASQIRAAVQKAVETTGKPAPGATQEPTQEAPVEVPQFFAKKKEAETPAFDPSKLPPELQAMYKSMQADYTKKTTEAAELRRQSEERNAKLDEERRVMLESQKALIEALKGRTPAPEAGANDPMAQIQALRDEGRHAEADQLLINVTRQLQEAQMEPIKKEAELNLLKTTFRDTTSEVMTANPVVQRYKDDVVKVFDGNSPVMQTLRPYLLRDAQSIRTFVPLVLNAIATELHAKAMEENFNKAVDAKVEKVLSERRSTASRVPPRLVETGGVSKESPPGKMQLKEAIALAVEASRTS